MPQPPRSESIRQHHGILCRQTSPAVLSLHYLDRQPSLRYLAVTKLPEAADNILKAVHRQRCEILRLQLFGKPDPQFHRRGDTGHHFLSMMLIEANGEQLSGVGGDLDGHSATNQGIRLEA